MKKIDEIKVGDKVRFVGAMWFNESEGIVVETEHGENPLNLLVDVSCNRSYKKCYGCNVFEVKKI